MNLGNVNSYILKYHFAVIIENPRKVGSQDLLLWREVSDRHEENAEWSDTTGVTGWLVSTIANVTEKIIKV